MTTLRIDTNNMSAIEEIKEMVRSHFHLDVQIVRRDTPSKSPSRWSEFTNKMDGLFTPEIVDHIRNSRQEARDNFTPNL